MRFVLAIVTAIGAMVFSSQAGAFCVYNQSSGTVMVFELYHIKGFDKHLKKGDKACCNWQTKDCNSSGRQAEMLNFQAQTNYSEAYSHSTGNDCGKLSTDWMGTKTFDLKLEAGGWFVFTDGGVKSYLHDGRLYSSYICQAR
jgi:hypothetical protein